MSLNETASGERVHIGFFGKRNAGKSSLVNALTNQELAVVSSTPGTTTDPVKKAMELLPLGPVMIIDTPGLDDIGELGALRVEKTKQMLDTCDIAVIVVESELSELENELIVGFKAKSIPYIIAYNKSDLRKERSTLSDNEIYLSAKSGENINALKNMLGALARTEEKYLVRDLLSQADTVVLVMPQDESAPKGRLILPQQQTIRDILDAHATVVCCQEGELKETLAGLKNKPKLVICDSKVFERVAKDTPGDILLTSFSILFARYKGELCELVRGADALAKLKDGDTVLISEGCTHHRQCGDIGSVKMPAWIKNYTNANVNYEFTSGKDFPSDLSKYALVVHCGGCTLTEREMQSRIEKARACGVPIVNYGVAIAAMHGVLKRSLTPFADLYELL